jgi:hypothetical protein
MSASTDLRAAIKAAADSVFEAVRANGITPVTEAHREYFLAAATAGAVAVLVSDVRSDEPQAVELRKTA